MICECQCAYAHVCEGHQAPQSQTSAHDPAGIQGCSWCGEQGGIHNVPDGHLGMKCKALYWRGPELQRTGRLRKEVQAAALQNLGAEGPSLSSHHPSLCVCLFAVALFNMDHFRALEGASSAQVKVVMELSQLEQLNIGLSPYPQYRGANRPATQSNTFQ